MANGLFELLGIGRIAAVTVRIVDTRAVDAYTAIHAVGAFLVLNPWHGKLTALYVGIGFSGCWCRPSAHGRVGGRLRSLACKCEHAELGMLASRMDEVQQRRAIASRVPLAQCQAGASRAGGVRPGR
jgi:hypothetical protein